MTTSIATSAPAKIVLSGEYAVLDGAPGIAMALDRRARVKLRAVEDSYSEIVSPVFSDKIGRCDVGVTPPVWQRGFDDYTIVDAVLRESREPLSCNYAMHLDTAAFLDGASGKKLGIGSSAALCVALALAVNASADITRIVFNAHRQFQDGAGSGIDIACSLRGGLLSYRMQGREIVSLDWPDRLSYRVLWSGSAVNTRDKLAMLKSASTMGNLASRKQLSTAAERMEACWRSSSATEILRGYAAYLNALSEFDEEHSLGIFAAGHGDLVRAARAAGLVYKPCGAGGGDIGIVLGTDDVQLDAFVARHSSSFRAVDCALDNRGATVESGSKHASLEQASVEQKKVEKYDA